MVFREKSALGTREMRGIRRTRREVTLWSNANDLSVAPGGPGRSVGEAKAMLGP